jgi:hypothetical protein
LVWLLPGFASTQKMLVRIVDIEGQFMDPATIPDHTLFWVDARVLRLTMIRFYICQHVYLMIFGCALDARAAGKCYSEGDRRDSDLTKIAFQLFIHGTFTCLPKRYEPLYDQFRAIQANTLPQVPETCACSHGSIAPIIH